MQGTNTKRDVGKHVARFILTGLYTGTRHARSVARRSSPPSGAAMSILIAVCSTGGRKAHAKPKSDSRLCACRIVCLRTCGVGTGSASPTMLLSSGTASPFARCARRSQPPSSGGDRGHVTPHVLRHTAATWAMQNGGDLWQIAGFLGMTVEMLERVYGHHHPDFQRGAAESISRSPGQIPGQIGREQTRQTSSNVTKIADKYKGRPIHHVRDVGVAGSNPATPTNT